MTPALFDAAKDDAAALAALHAASFPDPWSADDLANFLSSGAFAFHSPDGFVLARVAGGEAEILTIAVAPHARRRGLGAALVRAAAAHAATLDADAMFLEVSRANPAALALYKSVGFAAVGARKAYYIGSGKAEDAAILKIALPLPPPADFA